MRRRNPAAHKSSTFDWEAVHQRLAAVSAALDEDAEVSPHMRQRIWVQRAADLAQLPPQKPPGEYLELALVRLGQETYGIAVEHISDIRLPQPINKVPRTPDWALGVANLRGRIFSVIDLRCFFNLPRADETEETPPYLLLVKTPQREAVLAVDDVLGIESLPVSSHPNVHSTLHGLPAEYGVCLVERQPEKPDHGEAGLILALDLPSLLADPRLTIDEELI